jgi:hypothetical protein
MSWLLLLFAQRPDANLEGYRSRTAARNEDTCDGAQVRVDTIDAADGRPGTKRTTVAHHADDVCALFT